MFYQLVKLQEAEIIIKIESYIDSDFDIFMNRQLFDYFSKKSQKLKHYKKTHEIRGVSLGEKIVPNLRSPNIDKTILKELKGILDREVSSYSEIFFIEPYNGFGITPDYDLRRMSESTYRASEFIDYLTDNRIKHGIGADLATFLYQVSNYEQSRNMVARLVKRAMHNYKMLALRTMADSIFDNKMQFFFKEIYSLLRLYTPSDFDRHLCQDMPVIPYTTEVKELKRAYGWRRIVKNKNDIELEYSEYLFVTTNDYFTVKINETYSSASGNCFYITTKTHKENETISIFDKQICLNGGELTLLEMEHYADSGLLATSEFTINESIISEAIVHGSPETLYGVAYYKMLQNYYSYHKGSWLPTKYLVQTYFKPSYEGLKNIKRTWDNENTVMYLYKNLKNGENTRELPKNIEKLIEKRNSKRVTEKSYRSKITLMLLAIPLIMLAGLVIRLITFTPT